MTADQSESQFIFSEPGESPSLRVSIIYEDFASGLRAKACLDRLAQNLNVQASAFSVRPWSFSSLAESGTRSLSGASLRRAASAADRPHGAGHCAPGDQCVAIAGG